MTDTEPAPPPTPRWVTIVRKEIAELKKSLESTGGDVKELTRIARNCFDHLLIQEARIDKLKNEQETHDLELRNIRKEIAEIRTLLPPPPVTGSDAA